jgi:hypothetical protein
MANPNFDQILATTINNHSSQLEDNVFTARPLCYFLKQAGNIRMEDGGAQIILPIINAENQANGSFNGTDPLSTTASAGLTAAEYDWKQFYSTITISGREEFINAGTERIINLLEAKVMQAQETITEQLDEMFFGDGTGNSSKDWNGLGNLIAGHPNDTTIGGINPQSSAYWASYRNALAGPLTVAAMTTAFNTVTRGADSPKVVLTTQTLYEKYESLLQPQARYTSMETADAGFQNLLFKNVPVTYDTYCDSGYVYFVNPKYLRLVGHKDVWFKTTPFIRPEDVDAKYAQILLAGELTVSNRARQGVITGATA